MRVPRYVSVARADQVFDLPSGVTEAWLRTGHLRPVWFVDHGVIVRGVHVVEVRHLIDLRRALRVRRTLEAATTSAA